ncbi:MAG: sigma-54 dependent transcriptional regulator [Gammaproteobacteria bacterium]|nr:sigma-54 dependent transcriptional regulator [Gammaproteobacteria bacterium]
MNETTKILVIDDNETVRRKLQTILSFIGEHPVATDSISWRKLAKGRPTEYSAALIGQCNQTIEQLLQTLHQWEPGLPFILLNKRPTGLLKDDTGSSVIAALNGELSYQPLLDVLHKAKLVHEYYNRLRDFEGVRDYSMFRSLVGKSKAIQQVRHMMGQVANTEVSVLISGESGTGKEVVARNLHLNSARADKAFVPINCGAIPGELLESELFGHEKGAFTGAVASREGRFELADGGTLFLDEIGDMPLSMQVKLLRVLQERSFERVGGVKTIQSDVRILAATHKNLEEMIQKREFRQDLYYRLNVFPIEMPSLRERSEDVPLLLNELIAEMEAGNRGSVRFNSTAVECLCQYPWPGNVRELANLVERMAILHPHGILGSSDLPKNFRQPGLESLTELSAATLSSLQSEVVSADAHNGQSEELLPVKGIDLKQYLANLEKTLIAQALDDSGGVVARAADRLGIRRTTLVEKMRKYQLQKNA